MPGPSKQTGKAIGRRVGSSVGLGGAAGGAAYAVGGAALGGGIRTGVAMGAGLSVALLLAVFGESLFKHLASILKARGAAKAATSLAEAQATAVVTEAKIKKRLYRTGAKKAKTAEEVERLIRLFQDPDSGPGADAGQGGGQPGDGPGQGGGQPGDGPGQGGGQPGDGPGQGGGQSGGGGPGQGGGQPGDGSGGNVVALRPDVLGRIATCRRRATLVKHEAPIPMRGTGDAHREHDDRPFQRGPGPTHDAAAQRRSAHRRGRGADNASGGLRSAEPSGYLGLACFRSRPRRSITGQSPYPACRESNDSRHDHQRRPGPGGRRPVIAGKGVAKPACPATGPGPFLSQSGCDRAPRRYPPKPPAASSVTFGGKWQGTFGTIWQGR